MTFVIDMVLFKFIQWAAFHTHDVIHECDIFVIVYCYICVIYR